MRLRIFLGCEQCHQFPCGLCVLRRKGSAVSDRVPFEGGVGHHWSDDVRTTGTPVNHRDDDVSVHDGPWTSAGGDVWWPTAVLYQQRAAATCQGPVSRRVVRIRGSRLQTSWYDTILMIIIIIITATTMTTRQRQRQLQRQQTITTTTTTATTATKIIIIRTRINLYSVIISCKQFILF